MFTFTPLLGAQSSSAASQSLLELDGGIKILVDVGWDESFDGSKLQELEKHVSTLSIVLLTHPTIEHIGAYAHCCKHVPGFSRIPVYATTPVMNLGRTLITDLYASSPLAASIVPPESILSSPVSSSSPAQPNLLLQPPTPDEIAFYFSVITPLKYSQPHQPIPSPFSPSLSGLTITAYNAGHSLGGTIWHIQHGLESIVYAADWNLAREKFLPGAAWLSGNGILEPLHRPTALICSSRGVEREERLTIDARNETLISLIRETIAQGGKVLIPTDTSARVLELAFVLNSHWRANIDGPHSGTYKNAKIYMASHSSSATIRYLQSMLEWMDDSITRGAEAAITRGEGQGGGANPLDWKYVKQIEKKSQVERALARSKPCIVLASDASLEWGFSRQALESLAPDSKNLVVMTEEVAQGEGGRSGVGRRLWKLYQSQQGHSSSGAKIVNAGGASVDTRETSTESLNADENALYQQYLARQRQIHSSLQGDNTMNDASGVELGDDQASESSESSDEDEDTEHQGRALNLSAQLNQSKRKVGALTDAELGINVLIRGKNVHDYDVRNKRGREKMFPFVAHRTRDDEFGDIIKAEDYLRAEERDDGDAVDAKPEQEGAAVGQKRKWDDSSAKKGGNAEKTQNKKAKVEQSKKEREPDAIDALIAKATGEAGGAATNGAAQDDGSSDSEESEYEPEDAEESDEGPKKAVFTTRTLTLNLRIAHVDFSGLYRLNDMKSLIGNINPRKLIVTAGDKQETATLAEACRQAEGGKAVQGEIFTPVVGETVDASVDTNAWTVRLSRALMKRLQWGRVPGGLDVVAVMGRLEAGASDVKEEDESSAKKKVKLMKGQEAVAGEAVPAIPVLDLVPQQYAAQQRSTQPVHVGDLSLPQIREAVQRQGHTAEFRGGGTLLVDGTVVVRKSPATGGIEVEAGNSGLGLPQWRTTDKNGRTDQNGTFYAVKEVIYDKLAVAIGA